MSWMGCFETISTIHFFSYHFISGNFNVKNPWVLVGAEIRVLNLVQAVQWVALCFMLKKYFCYESKHSFFKKRN